MSDALNTLLKNKFEMKTFTHAPIPDDQIPEVFTETINRKRFYVTPDGNKYPSITTVLSGRAKEGINAWRQRVGEAVANNIMRTAAKRGTAVHELCENYLNNEELKNQEVLPEVFTETINKKRFYVTPEGNKYPSITTVLGGRAKEGINAWRKRVGEAVANNIMRTAARRGTAVHELCEN